MAFWTRFLDEMARHRYNVLSLWSLSPFPSLVKVPEYPKVALADVKRKTGAMFDATNQGRNMYDPSWPLETVRTMTIDEKIAFWRGVMQYARDRGIDVSVFTWNIFVYGTEGSGYGLTVDPRNAATKDYVRKSTRALFNTYPLLTAIGVTSGENMGDLDDAGKEQWMWETYGLGVKDAMADAADPASPFHRPGRHITLIHRAHQADLKAIVETFKALPGSDRSGADSTLAFSFKYSQAHMHSSTAPRFIFQNGWYDSMPPGKQTWLTVRNDDLYYLRWGDPDFVRALLDAAAAAAEDRRLHARARRLHVGPRLRQHAGRRRRGGWSSRSSGTGSCSGAGWPTSRRCPNEPFQAALEARFPRAGAAALRGLSSASRILPLVNRFYWGYFDFMWYPEASWSQAGFVGVRELHHAEVPADARGRGRRAAAHHVGEGVRRSARSPAGQHHAARGRRASWTRCAADGVLRLRSVPAQHRSPSSRRRVGDIRAMAALGRYYAAKIRGAVELARYEKTQDAAAHARARTALQASAGALARVRAPVERAERRQRVHAARPDAGRHDGDPGGGGQGHPGAAARWIRRALSRGRSSPGSPGRMQIARRQHLAGARAIARAGDPPRRVEIAQLVAERAVQVDDPRRRLVHEHDRPGVRREARGRAHLVVPREAAPRVVRERHVIRRIGVDEVAVVERDRLDVAVREHPRAPAPRARRRSRACSGSACRSRTAR